jgi:hypothetical protein
MGDVRDKHRGGRDEKKGAEQEVLASWSGEKQDSEREQGMHD